MSINSGVNFSQCDWTSVVHVFFSPQTEAVKSSSCLPQKSLWRKERLLALFGEWFMSVYYRCEDMWDESTATSSQSSLPTCALSTSDTDYCWCVSYLYSLKLPIGSQPINYFDWSVKCPEMKTQAMQQSGSESQYSRVAFLLTHLPWFYWHLFEKRM